MTPTPWQVGDTLAVGKTRWQIRALNRKTKQVVLDALNTTNHAMSWSTHLDKLPRKAHA